MPLPPKTPSSLASFKARRVLPLWYQLTLVVLEKRLLIGVVVVVVIVVVMTSCCFTECKDCIIAATY